MEAVLGDPVGFLDSSLRRPCGSPRIDDPAASRGGRRPPRVARQSAAVCGRRWRSASRAGPRRAGSRSPPRLAPPPTGIPGTRRGAPASKAPTACRRTASRGSAYGLRPRLSRPGRHRPCWRGRGRAHVGRARVRPARRGSPPNWLSTRVWCSATSAAARGCPDDQAATKDAFEVLHFIAGEAAGGWRLTVVDATNVQPEARKPLVELAREYDCLPVASSSTCLSDSARSATAGGRTGLRPARDPPSDAATAPLAARARARKASATSSCCAPGGGRGGQVERQPLWNEPADRARPLRHHRRRSRLLRRTRRTAARARLRARPTTDGAGIRTPPAGRKAVFLGDLVDRGPDSPGTCCGSCMTMVAAGHRALRAGQPRHEADARSSAASDVQITHGLAESLAQLEARARRSSASRSPRSSTGWSATTCSTTASWSWRTPA